MKPHYFLFMILFITAFFSLAALYRFNTQNGPLVFPFSPSPTPTKHYLQFLSVDTMKYSRDPSREKLNDPAFDTVIDEQVGDIAKMGATHVAIGTPYDEEFISLLKRWVASARKHELKVWFRGNFSGWEGWFGYPKITRAEHLEKTKNFIQNNPDLFEDGDIFGACNECENGGPGDPRSNGDVVGHRQFLIDEYSITKNTFGRIQKNVASNYSSMNGDVAALVMDKPTTKALDGIVVVDHYVTDPNKLVDDLVVYARNSGGKVVLGEVGAPIPDLHPNMTDGEQEAWIRTVFTRLLNTPEVVGVNYWVSVGGSTTLYDLTNAPKPAVNTLRGIFKENQSRQPLLPTRTSPI